MTLAIKGNRNEGRGPTHFHTLGLCQECRGGGLINTLAISGKRLLLDFHRRTQNLRTLYLEARRRSPHCFHLSQQPAKFSWVRWKEWSSYMVTAATE